MEAAPEECCGLIGRRRRRFELYPCRNVSLEPTTSFVVNPFDQIAALELIEHRRQEFWGIYHSHPSQGADLSERDIAFRDSIGGDLYWVVVGLAGGYGIPELFVHAPL